LKSETVIISSVATRRRTYGRTIPWDKTHGCRQGSLREPSTISMCTQAPESGTITMDNDFRPAYGQPLMKERLQNTPSIIGLP